MLALRFVHDLTQTEIAEQIGVSQMQISRILRRSIARLGELAERGRRSPTPSRSARVGSLVRHAAGHPLKARVRTQSPTVRLELESRPQVLTIVRGMLAGMAEPLSIDAELLDDVKTAVSEACNNVVLHAYGGRRRADGHHGLRRIRGDPDCGHRPRGGHARLRRGPGTGIGLSVIRALAETVTHRPRTRGRHRASRWSSPPSARDRRCCEPPRRRRPRSRLAGVGGRRGGALGVSDRPCSPRSSGRMARTLAATAHFSLDRFSDVYLVTDALAAHATEAALDGRIDARLCAGERRLELEVGPFRAGASDHLAAPAPGTRSPLALLSDEVRIERGDAGDRAGGRDRRPP